MARKYRIDRFLILPLYRLIQRLRGSAVGTEGIALAMLVKLLDWARAEKLPLARLETGNVSVGALKLYRRAGFKEIPAFPPYKPDPLSIFMERALR